MQKRIKPCNQIKPKETLELEQLNDHRLRYLLIESCTSHRNVIGISPYKANDTILPDFVTRPPETDRRDWPRCTTCCNVLQ